MITHLSETDLQLISTDLARKKVAVVVSLSPAERAGRFVLNPTTGAREMSPVYRDKILQAMLAQTSELEHSLNRRLAFLKLLVFGGKCIGEILSVGHQGRRICLHLRDAFIRSHALPPSWMRHNRLFRGCATSTLSTGATHPGQSQPKSARRQRALVLAAILKPCGMGGVLVKMLAANLVPRLA